MLGSKYNKCPPQSLRNGESFISRSWACKGRVNFKPTSWLHSPFSLLFASLEKRSHRDDLEVGVSRLQPMGQMRLPLFRSSCLETQTYPFTYVVSTAAFLLQPRSWLVVTETAWPEKPKWFIIGSLTEKFYHALIQRMVLYWYFPVGALQGWSQGDSQMLGLVTDPLLPLPRGILGHQPCFLLSSLFI